VQPPIENQPLPLDAPKSNTFKQDLWEIVQTLLLALLLYFAINAVFDRRRVDNISMETTFMPGDLLVVNRLQYKFSSYQVGDVIVFHDPLDIKEDFIKRIIGRPGDTVSIHDGQVAVNGVVLKETYISEVTDYQGDWVVPANNLFVLGDNRNQSSDSHIWGFVPLNDVLGRVIFEYWPLNKIHVVRNPFK
jgi:signal peptidase I